MTPQMMKTALDSRAGQPTEAPAEGQDPGLLGKLRGLFGMKAPSPKGPSAFDVAARAKLRKLFGLDQEEDPQMLAGQSRELYRKPPFSAEPYDPSMRAAWESQQRRYL